MNEIKIINSDLKAVNINDQEKIGVKIFLDNGKYLLDCERMIIQKNFHNKNILTLYKAKLIGELNSGEKPFTGKYKEIYDAPFFIISKLMEIMVKIKYPYYDNNKIDYDEYSYYFYADINQGHTEYIRLKNYTINIKAYDRTNMIVFGDSNTSKINNLNDFISVLKYRMLANINLTVINQSKNKDNITICLFDKTPAQALDIVSKVYNIFWNLTTIEGNDLRLEIFDKNNLINRNMNLEFVECNSFNLTWQRSGKTEKINNCYSISWENNVEYFNVLHFSIYDNNNKWLGKTSYENSQEIERLKLNRDYDDYPWDGKWHKTIVLTRELVNESDLKKTAENYFDYFKNEPLSLVLKFKNYLPSIYLNSTASFIRVGKMNINFKIINFKPYNQDKNILEGDYIVKQITEEYNNMTLGCYVADIAVVMDKQINMFQPINYYDEKQNLNSCEDREIVIANDKQIHEDFYIGGYIKQYTKVKYSDESFEISENAYNLKKKSQVGFNWLFLPDSLEEINNKRYDVKYSYFHVRVFDWSKDFSRDDNNQLCAEYLKNFQLFELSSKFIHIDNQIIWNDFIGKTNNGFSRGFIFQYFVHQSQKSEPFINEFVKSTIYTSWLNLFTQNLNKNNDDGLNNKKFQVRINFYKSSPSLITIKSLLELNDNFYNYTSNANSINLKFNFKYNEFKNFKNIKNIEIIYGDYVILGRTKYSIGQFNIGEIYILEIIVNINTNKNRFLYQLFNELFDKELIKRKNQNWEWLYRNYISSYNRIISNDPLASGCYDNLKVSDGTPYKYQDFNYFNSPGIDNINFNIKDGYDRTLFNNNNFDNRFCQLGYLYLEQNYNLKNIENKRWYRSCNLSPCEDVDKGILWKLVYAVYRVWRK